MNSKFKYENELNKLIECEENFAFFINLAKESVRTAPEAFKEVFDNVLEFAKANNLNISKGWSYYYLGWYFFDLSKYDEAIENFLLSHDVFDTHECKKGVIYSCNGLTNIYCQIGQFMLANEWGLKGIYLAEEIGEKEELVILLINIGINYIQMKDYYKSKEILNSIKMLNHELTKRQIVACKLCLAEIEINIGNPAIALVYLDEVSKMDDELTVDTSDAFKLKGMAYVKINEYEMAKKEFVKSYDFSNLQGYTYEKCCALIEWAKLSYLIKRQHEAINVLKEVADIAKSSKFIIILKDTFHLLYEMYKELGNHKKSLRYLEEYISIDDQIYDYEQNQLMAKMNINHTKREANLYKLLYDKTELLSSIGQKIISNLDLNSIINIINKEIYKLIKTDIFGIAVYDTTMEEVAFNFVRGNSDLIETIPFNINDESSFGAYCLKNKADIIIGDVEQEYSKYVSSDYVNHNDSKFEKSRIYTTLIIKGRVVGVMTAQSYMENTYDTNDLNTLKIIANYSAIAIDNAMSYKKIEDIATYDNMTGFLTRFEIIRLGEIIYEKHRNKHNSFCVIMIDIDNFKSINDSYGHVYGDRALNKVTSSISQCIRTTDYIGRYGGDEFLLICPGADQKEAIEVAERIRNTICNNSYVIDDEVTVNITLSLGVYEFGKNDMSFIDGVKMADKYLYNAKKGSKNKVVSKLKSKHTKN
ncbi:diguanylate cyclase (GGDEF)-like protein [Sedimentibacter acidaminivorans]|uniref:Diguanylate cyclase (GGDEF)-like protein n=1 Tax=Sedimentibacter acidaminivorans TaxID=913099 RepID=A0ABS4GAE5_9FIRM|nr:sensor domain-containing diguanylate cyclase [Sedimentibacter acidaminivorans]MBP1924639.1 diguanylate cyclase (GGDEF)-like protein [Sedimentibacter acidaminivorans]